MSENFIVCVCCCVFIYYLFIHVTMPAAFTQLITMLSEYVIESELNAESLIKVNQWMCVLFFSSPLSCLEIYISLRIKKMVAWNRFLDLRG